MKKFKLLGLAFIAILLNITACGVENTNETIPTPDEPNTEKPNSEIKIDSSITTNGILFSDEKGEQSINFTTNEDWTLSIAETRNGTNWVTPSATNGPAGDATIIFKVTENSDYEDRSVTVTIKAGASHITFKITQKSIDALLISSTTYEVPQEGSTIEIEVKSNIDYTMEISETDKKWITEITTRSLNTSKHSIKIDANEEYEKRIGQIYFKSQQKTETVNIYQTGGPIILLSQNEFTVSDKGETISVEIKSNCEYGIQMPNVDWIFEESSRVASSHTLKYMITANESEINRSAQIIFYDNDSYIADTLTIIQNHKGFKEIKNLKAGDLSKIISSSERQTISELYLSGDLNGSDIQVIREMGGCDVNGDYTNGILKTLDIQNCNIVSGGNPYIFSKYTENNILGSLMFQGCKSLEKVYLSNSIVEIKEKAFLNCENMKNIILPKRVELLGENAFDGCLALDSLLIPGSIKTLPCLGKTSVKHITLDRGVNEIGYLAFTECSQLESIIIPRSVKYIGHAFSYGRLKRIYVDDLEQWYQYDWYNPNYPFEAVTRSYVNGEMLTDEGFEGMGNLYVDNELISEVSIPSSMTIIKPYVFSGCANIEKITIPNTVTEIKNNAFSGTRISNIVIPNSVTSLGDFIFTNCYNLKEIKLSNILTKLPNGFAQDSGLREFVIPNHINHIGYQAFSYCQLLEKVTLSNTLEILPDFCFNGCKKLKKIVLPSSINTLSSYAFSYSGIEEVYCESKTPPYIYKYTFEGTNYEKIKIYVPKGSLKDYKTSDWGYYFKNIIEISQ